METIDPISPQDLDQIWTWNSPVPDPIHGCVHDLIAEVARRQPEALAIDAWDLQLTYQQLDTLSNGLAQHLILRGVTPGFIIPVLFTKSGWTPVAMLAAIKMGSSVVALDATQPDARLRAILEQVQPALVLASPALYKRAENLIDGTVLAVDQTLLDHLSGDEIHPPQVKVQPSDLVYISFTSGTTGQPKGACISHTNVRSTVHYQGARLGFSPTTRVFDLAPYSFDVAWSNVLHTLCAGACLCIASEDAMLDDLAGAIVKAQATLLNVTPTVLRTITHIPACLETVLLSGEMPYRDNIDQWAGRVRLLNTYGPTECTFKCAFSELGPSLEGRPDIGRGVGFATWIVDPDEERLMPLGQVGELCLEGPMVGQGYLGDAEKTASAFIESPGWLSTGTESVPGRSGQVYKTGDLVKYTPEGRLMFVGRKDASQLKIRGQRIEIGDVEHHVRVCLGDTLSVVADVLVPKDSDSAALALFVVAPPGEQGKVREHMDGLGEKLQQVLPGFMIPTVYLPIDEIPVAATGKVDRRKLREWGGAKTWDELISLQSNIVSSAAFQEPATETERTLQQIWATVLGLDPGHIGRDDSFLRLGGDSVTAMRVVALARDKLSVTVADLFRTPVLHELASVVQDRTPTGPVEIPPFSLLQSSNIDTIVQEAATLCGIETTDIEDIYPCTPLQQGMLATTARNEAQTNGHDTLDTQDYVSRTAYPVPPSEDIKSIEAAWARVVQMASILRTRIVEIAGHGLVQVVVKDSFTLASFSSIQDFCRETSHVGLGAPMWRAGYVMVDEKAYFMLEMHHALYDGWSSALLLETVRTAINSPDSPAPLSPVQPFIQHVLASDNSTTADFWREYLAASEAVVFPALNYDPSIKLDLHHSVSQLSWPSTGFTPSTIVRAAMSLLLAVYTNSSDTIFGATVSGRGAPVPGMERIAAPTIATVPVRVRFEWEQSVEELLRSVQNGATEATAHEQFGLQRIQRIGAETADASQFQTLLVIQPVSVSTEGPFAEAKSVISVMEDGTKKTLKLVTKDGEEDTTGIHNTYAIMVVCHLQDEGLRLHLNFDTGAVALDEVKRFASQFEQLIRQLCTITLQDARVSDLTTLSSQDLCEIWDWNKTLPAGHQELITAVIDKQAETRGDAVAISSWDQQLTYRQLQNITLCLAARLREQGIGPGSIIILCFDKSSWLILTMIASLRLGAVVLPISASATAQRAGQIVDAVKPSFVLGGSKASPFQGLVPVVSVPELVEPADKDRQFEHPAHRIHVSDSAVILNTSGSTGVPKCILWSHGILSTNVLSHAATFQLDRNTRLFQFAGYEFDVSTMEALSTLSAGGCLCIPSESDRTDRLADALNETQANFILLTPSVAESLTPADLPFLKTVLLGGEKLSYKAAFRWDDGTRMLFNWYGPAEAAAATFYRITKETWKQGVVGKGMEGVTWLVDPKDVTRLAPIGAIAELCLEGPIVAKYTGAGSEALNEQSLFQPPWLAEGCPPIPGRTGTLYRTGDLVRYDTEGRLVYLGRRQDAQRKLRGHRVDLSEIEFLVQTFLAGRAKAAVVAEILSPAQSNAEILALFVSVTGASSDEEAAAFVKQFPVQELEEVLYKTLPSYMIPKVYVPLLKIPMGKTSKTDRRKLRQIGSELSYEQLATMQPSRRQGTQPSTEAERQLQAIWAAVIGIKPEAIHANDHFLRLGGDSITAMRLVALARAQGLSLTVRDVFEAPQLDELAKRVQRKQGGEIEDVPPFSLLNAGLDAGKSRAWAARLCSIPESKVVDMYPCTALQQGLLALGARRHGQYISRSVLPLQPGIDASHVEKAWLATARRIPLLRTRIVDLPGQGYVQVVLQDAVMHKGTSLDEYVRHDEAEPMAPGTELCRAAVVEGHFVLAIHHCTYDGNTLKMVLDELEAQYLGSSSVAVTPFNHFIQHLSRVDQVEAAAFWEKQLTGLEARQFPVLPSEGYEPLADGDLRHPITLTWPRTGITPSTLIRAAWSILATQYTSSNDVLFALTVNGRHADMPGIETCVGPTISTVPMAVSVDWNQTVGAFLDHLQRRMMDTTRFEQYGLQNMRLSDQDRDARLLQTLLVIQPVDEGKSLDQDGVLFKARSFASNRSTTGMDPFNNYGLKVVCELESTGLRLYLSFDSHLIDDKQMGRIAQQFEIILKQLCAENADAAKLEMIQTASHEDLALFWAQNATLPAEPDELVHQLIAKAAQDEPDKIAIDAWDGQFWYRQVDELSSHLAQSLMSLGIKKGSIVALNFEKSKWVPVAQIAIFKAGAVDVLQSISVPDLRIGRVFTNIGCELAIVSPTRKELVSQFAPSYTVDELLAIVHDPLPFPVVTKKDAAAILVSSGSTGEPKQVLWSHRAVTANVRAHGDFLYITPASRVFQFASYDFDVSTIESMSTLVHRGCLCIPSEAQRLDATAAAIDGFRTTFLNITPSTAKALQPEDVPTVEMLVLSGENLVQDDVDRWKGRHTRVLNWYGPAEHPATVCDADADTWHSSVIGSIDSRQPVLCWLVDPNDHNRLVPFGAIGEIALEGPLCADGYIANPAMTAQRFRTDPRFLTTGHKPTHPGRSNHIYCSGDLGRYGTAGQLIYMGRKDSQLKIRGQLVAPEEVEHHVRRLLAETSESPISVVVDGIRAKSSNLTLVAFLNLPSEEAVEAVTVGLNDKLKRVLPPYAIPVYYIPVPEFPKNASAKTDRARLRALGAEYEPSRQAGPAGRAALSTAEKTLRDLWVRALGVDADEIGKESSFLRLGDSVQAMRLVGIARQQGLLLTVAGVFENPTLVAMAKTLRNLDEAESVVVPFSLLGTQDVDTARGQAATLCGVERDQVEDVFPCTPLQEGLLALTMRRQGDYIGRNILRLKEDVDITRFKAAWEEVVETISILRTRICDLPGYGLVQATIQTGNVWTDAKDLDDYLTQESQLPMGLGVPLMRCALLPSPPTFILTMHHSIYDGLTTPLILEALEARYNGLTPLRHAPFQSFTQYITAQDAAADAAYWRAEMRDFQGVQFPALPSVTYQPKANATLTHVVGDVAWRADEITPTTVIRAVTALLCAQYSQADDVAFGVVSSGRKAPVPGIETLPGPTIATVPLRVKIDQEQTTAHLLNTLQTQSTKMIPHEQTGLSRIRHLSPHAEQACDFQTLLVVQMKEESQAPTSSALFAPDAQPDESQNAERHLAFQSYALSIICTPEHDRIELIFCFDTGVVSRAAVVRMASDFEVLLRKVCAIELDGAALGDVGASAERDAEVIWRWNETLPARVDRCVHELVFEGREADAVAISAWDGEMTYRQLDETSTRIAHRLVEKGLQPNTVVPLCFEKSSLALVVLLGVLKAGSAGLFVDKNVSPSQLESVLSGKKSCLILSSAANQEVATALGPEVLVLDPETYPTEEKAECSPITLPRVDASSLAYAILDDGQTDTPELCPFSHANLSSAISYEKPGRKLNDSRVYVSGALTSGFFLRTAFHVLAAGGTLFIPSKDTDLADSIQENNLTDLFLTPLVAETLNPVQLPSVRNVILGGDEIRKDDVAHWMSHADVSITYTPVMSAGRSMHKPTKPLPQTLSVGKVSGAIAWILDMRTSDKLAPLGAIGELYLEGPAIATNSLTEASSSFVDSPHWLTQGSPNSTVPGRNSRLYKTGDLARYDLATGDLIVVGKKARQARLRGQRIDLALVEYWIRRSFATQGARAIVAAEVILPSSELMAPALYAFIQAEMPSAELNELLSKLEDMLRHLLPLHMIPSAYIPVAAIPYKSGRVDRNELRMFGASLAKDQLNKHRGSGTLPSTDEELALQQLWASILQIDAENVYTDSSFIRLGGDSVSAMRLTALARRHDFSLTVQDILLTPRLSQMAASMTKLDPHGDKDTVEPFSLLKHPSNKATIVDYISRQCNVEAWAVEDVFPCTSVQKSLLSMTARSDNSYVARYGLFLREDIDIYRLKAAWEEVSKETAPILRYRIVDIPTEGLVQVQLAQDIEWDEYDSEEKYNQHNQNRSMGLGTPLTRLAIVRKSDGRHSLFITQHHAIYDGYSVNLLLTEVSKAYAGIVDDSPVAPFQAFFKHVAGVNQDNAHDFWRDQFAGSEAVPFPVLPEQEYRPKADSAVRRNIENFVWPKQDATASTILRAAWTILTARYTGTDDVVFGAMVTGRQAPLPGINRMIAPLISAVPVRVAFDATQTVQTLLSQIQTQAIATIAYENTELLAIRRLSPEADRASRFNTLLIVQPPPQSDYLDDSPFVREAWSLYGGSGLDDFNPNAVMVMAQLTNEDRLELDVSFDSRVVDKKQMDRMVAQFEHVLRHICASTAQKVQDVEAISAEDVAELWKWNASVPEAVSETVHDLIGKTVQRQPEAPAICAWDGDLTYQELDTLSAALAAHLVASGIGYGSIVPLCFEKSMWYPVAALGIMRAGAACLAMDSTQPETRLQSIIQQVSPRFILASATNETMAGRLSDAKVVVVDRGHMSKYAAASRPDLPKVQPSDTLYVVFTSGSTGVPKGIITTHQNFATAAVHQTDILHIKPGTRVFDFVSYNFDVSWSNHLQTLICGGCLCIPSETERRNDIPGALNRMRCDYVYFTPSVAHSLDPVTMPAVRTLAMGGEPIQSREVARWPQTEQVIGIYGPAECAQALSFTLLEETTPNNHVGHSYGANTWLVEPGRPDRLAPIGTIAELVIEGPTVSKGYFGDAARTSAAYIQDPAWLSRGGAGNPGRKGTLYMTGDLLRYNSDGSLDFVGRKDGMIKLRGQRIELSEVEFHVRASLHDPSLCAGIAAEIIRPEGSASPLLAVFFSLAGQPSKDETQTRLSLLMKGLEKKLWDRLPQYMVPSTYIHIPAIPMTSTNKVDRRALREFGSSQPLEALAMKLDAQDHHEPSTELEKRLQALWASVLEIDAASIHADSNFLRIGGESIAAMRLVAKAREQKLALTVADVFRAPKLSDLALVVTEAVDEEMRPTVPFALLPGTPQDFLAKFITSAVDPGIGSVKDVVPATDFQELSVRQALQNPPGRYPHWIFDLPADVDFARLQDACVKVVNHFDILHTVFVQAEDKLWQVLLSNFKLPYDYMVAGQEDIQSFTNTVCEEDLQRPRVLGQPFMRFVAVRHESGKHKLIWRISHALFDGFSWGLVLETLSHIYAGDALDSVPTFGRYMTFLHEKKAESILHWTTRLQGSTPMSWTEKNLGDRTITEARVNIKETVVMPPSWKDHGIPMATLFHAACAIALARLYNKQEIVFGRLVTGRSMLPGALQSVVGPTMTEVPVRVRVDVDVSLIDIAFHLQNTFIEDSMHETAGMVEIIRNCTDWRDCSDFGWRTAFQQEEDETFSFLGTPSSISFHQRAMPARERPEVYATPMGDGVQLEFEGDSRTISVETVESFLGTLKDIIGKF